MSTANGFLDRYRARGWRCVPVHRPDPATAGCSCGKPQCAKPGKHPVAAFWPGGSTDPANFEGRNLGVQLGPVSKNLADVDLDCDAAVLAAPFLLPPTDCAFGRGGQATHSLYTVTDETASFAKLTDPVLDGSLATIIELRWPEWDADESRFKSIQTVVPPSLHSSGETVAWLREGEPARVAGADLAAAVRHIAVAVLIARYARPKERHALVLLVANLLVRADWDDDARVIAFLTAVFTARKDADKVAKIADGEGRGAVQDARKRLKAGKPMSGLPALRAMLDPAIDSPTADNPACLPGTESRNWNSTDDVRSAFLQLGITLDSTDDSALAAIDHPLASLVRDYRGVTKRVGTYGKAWLEKHVGSDGRVLPSWNQLGADSGRMSCSNPNLQQIPRGSNYRSCIVAAPGKMLVKADYSQIELRIAAKIANEEVMIRAYRNGGDLHRLTAARVLGKPEAEVTKADRQIAKSLNFGLLYGMGWRGLRGYALANYGVSLTDSQAQGYRNSFFRAYPALRAWHQQVTNAVGTVFQVDPAGTHEVWTLGGRKRVLSVAKKRGDGTPYPNITDALNSPVQGTGADGLKGAITRLWETRTEHPGAIPVLYCHDEIVLEVEAAEANRASEWLRTCMIEAVAPFIDPVPVEVEVTIGRTWGG